MNVALLLATSQGKYPLSFWCGVGDQTQSLQQTQPCVPRLSTLLLYFSFSHRQGLIHLPEHNHHAHTIFSSLLNVRMCAHFYMHVGTRACGCVCPCRGQSWCWALRWQFLVCQLDYNLTGKWLCTPVRNFSWLSLVTWEDLLVIWIFVVGRSIFNLDLTIWWAAYIKDIEEGKDI